MDLENYTNINIFKKVFENREVSQASHVIEQPHHMNKGNREHHGGFNPYKIKPKQEAAKCNSRYLKSRRVDV